MNSFGIGICMPMACKYLRNASQLQKYPCRSVSLPPQNCLKSQQPITAGLLYQTGLLKRIRSTLITCSVAQLLASLGHIPR